MVYSKLKYKMTCVECAKPFNCLCRNWELEAGCKAVRGQGCRCSICMMMGRLRKGRRLMENWNEKDSHVFKRCWGITGKKLEKLKNIARMVA